MNKQKIIAIDFDGTITTDSPYPITGKIRPEAVKVIKKLQSVYTCILWTNREGAWLEEAKSLLKEHGIEFEYINCDLVNTSRKIYADVFIDDRAFGTIIDWYKIEKTLLEDKTNE